MVRKSYEKKDKKGKVSEWEWEETPEVKEALKKLHDSTLRVQKETT